MKSLFTLLIALVSLTLHGQSILKCTRTSKDFPYQPSAFETPTITSSANSSFTNSYQSANNVKDIRVQKGLLAGGIISCTLGTGSLITASLETKSRSSFTQSTTPFIITGVVLNLVCMPVCFVVRDLIRKKHNHINN